MQNGNTVLHRAVDKGHEGIGKLLLEAGAKTNIMNSVRCLRARARLYAHMHVLVLAYICSYAHRREGLHGLPHPLGRRQGPRVCAPRVPLGSLRRPRSRCLVCARGGACVYVRERVQLRVRVRLHVCACTCVCAGQSVFRRLARMYAGVCVRSRVHVRVRE